ncbi:RNA methyltransferase [Candidatus Thorarchaeota archaeon]|nr:MAG: RNA methyltransferase [Candidatus Thorarchaeota archaeon]
MILMTGESGELDRLAIVLVEPETPGNVGFTARVMANFGVSDLRIVGTDPRGEEEAQIYSVNALGVLESARIFDTLGSALGDIHASWAATARIGGNHSVTRAVVPLPELPDPLSLDGRVALVFGRESSGLTNEEISVCDLAFSIPVSERYTSLNLSHAVAVTLYHMFVRYSDVEDFSRSSARPANRREKEQAKIFFDEVVDMIPFRDFRRPLVKQVFANLLGRSYLTGREVTTLIGAVRKIRDSLREWENHSA